MICKENVPYLKVLSQHLTEEPEEDGGRLSEESRVFQPSFELVISRIQVRSVTARSIISV
jgi:hypothetical protein